ncbi:MAG: outer membrane lipoprotein carrier protein LolA [Flavobacteriales bacterium]|nr:outer membrane lipoprotein carrier protein LolA [Flavobacteriales bacterium]
MKKIFLLVSIVGFSTMVFAQSNKGELLLDKVSANTSAYQDIEMTFTYNMDNNTEDIHQSKSGIVYINKDKFNIDLEMAVIIYDGNKRYTIVDDEVTISSAEDESGISSPTQILDMYKEGYVIKWDIEQKVPGKTIQYVRLIPIDTNSEYQYILIGSDIKSNDLYNVIYTDKQGTQFKLQINTLKANQNLPASLFTFDKSKYPESEYLYTDLDE